MVKVELILGPVLTAVVVNALLYGVCVLQFSTYYTVGFKDRPHIKFLVFWVLLLDTYHTASSIYLLWDYVVTNFNNPEILIAAPWPFPSTPIVTAFASVPIQHYLAWRIKAFTNSWWIFGILSIFSVGQGALAIASAVEALLAPNISYFAKIIPLVDSWLAMAIVCDLSITALLTMHLRKSRTGFRRTDNVITNLIRSSVETAAFAFFFCVMDFITFTTLQDTNFHLIFALPMGRIYTNTLLTTLNARASLRHELSGVRDTTFNIGSGTPKFSHTTVATEDPLKTTQLNITIHQDVQMEMYSSSDGKHDMHDIESAWNEQPGERSEIKGNSVA